MGGDGTSLDWHPVISGVGDAVDWKRDVQGNLAATDNLRGRAFREITVDRESLQRGLVIPVDAQTGELLENVRTASIETPFNDVCILHVDFILTEPYPREDGDGDD